MVTCFDVVRGRVSCQLYNVWRGNGYSALEMRWSLHSENCEYDYEIWGIASSFYERDLCGRISSTQYSSAPGSASNTFQDLPLLRETMDNTERYI
jgi:hypothetical protein